MLTFVFRPDPPYDFAKTIRRFCRVTDGTVRIVSDTVYRTTRVEGKPVLLEIRSTSGNADSAELFVRVCAPSENGLTETEALTLKAKLESMLAIAGPWRAFSDWLLRHPRLGTLGVAMRGLRLWLDGDPFESLIRTIVSQQLSTSFALTLCSRLVETAGDVLEWNGERFSVFPTPERLASLDENRLRSLQFSRQKSEYVLTVSRAAADRRWSWDQLDEMADEEAVAFLTGFRGIGRWTAECYLLLGRGRQDALPAADLGLRKAIGLLYGLQRLPSEAEVRTLAEEWAPWRGYVALYLWESLAVGGLAHPPISVDIHG